MQDTPVARLAAINAPAIELYRSHGIDLTKERLEISVCAQHHNGGIAVDADWQTSVPGLYVCGEAAGTFGRTRPGGTALNSTQVGSMRAARHMAADQRIPGEAVCIVPDVPQGDVEAETERQQREMTRVAAFLRDEKGMQALAEQTEQALSCMAPASLEDQQLEQRLKLLDILLTQREVLSAMRCSMQETGTSGVLLTGNGHSKRVPARPFPERDLWFERVWKKYRNEK